MDSSTNILPLVTSVLLVVAAAATIAAVLVRRRRQRPYSTEISDISMRECWDSWANGTELDDKRRELRDGLLQVLDQAAIDTVREDLLRLERDFLGGKYPLTEIRKELMASVDRRMLNTEILRLPEDVKAQVRGESPDLIQNDLEARRYIAANELRLQVLREFATRRYGDFAKRDWFAVYEQASRLKQRNARFFIEQALRGPGLDSDNPHHQAISMVDSQLKVRLLEVPPGTEFPMYSDDGSRRLQ